MSILKKLLNYQENISSIQYTINILRWELRISTPNDAKDDLINLITHYENKLFQLQTSSNYGDLLNDVVKSEEFKKLEINKTQEAAFLYDLRNKKMSLDEAMEGCIVRKKANKVLFILSPI